MHGSHKLWITISVFLVVIAFLLGMYFTATPDKVGSVIKQKQSEKMQKTTSETGKVANENVTPEKMAEEENILPDEQKTVDMSEIGAGDAANPDEEMPKPDSSPEE